MRVKPGEGQAIALARKSQIDYPVKGYHGTNTLAYMASLWVTKEKNVFLIFY
jgi:hypothetical protein